MVGVTTLQGDESASVDPALAVSNIAHQLWRAARNPRMGDEQQHNARTLADTIIERHYPQRFEHPVLRLFRIGGSSDAAGLSARGPAHGGAAAQQCPGAHADCAGLSAAAGRSHTLSK